jgi:hypothetical protein
MFSQINCSTKGRIMTTSQKAQDKKEKIQVLSLAKERYLISHRIFLLC